MSDQEESAVAVKRATLDAFAHHWTATVLRERPLILPRRRYVYPREAEEIERGALELLVHPGGPGDCKSPDRPDRLNLPHRSQHPNLPDRPDRAEPFLATCALGFADPIAPTGVWSCPHPDQLCAVAGGYAYLIDTRTPERFEQVAYRPVLNIHAAASQGLLLFVGNQRIVAYNAQGRAWESPRLSDEGIDITTLDRTHLHGTGWQLATDMQFAFCVDLRTGMLTLTSASGNGITRQI